MVTRKNVGLRKFWLGLEISEARFLMGLEVSFLGDSCVSEFQFFFFAHGFLESRI